ncbi:hypothetical protein E6P09_09235 [Haloferax mediterranei ATCC 33500]|uniref:Uncharacterized protein n=1 Tax=Haloferax mediterranei (strain ATCC 33500 / DSM 1411 / JCM 8866 / NBRC 14739 / NCIMB 2177 / R-4) TaxID=523841 RepID=I3R3Z8_HALMT|nr:hypothetical protein [Haloferax mediterranei]AFK18958.1 hypothetical protein HFX_1245 [Haloferax mediterranei ATCC 33500]AHZ21680.1 hypothetical protein BM92_02965 [Haloferax mediterranei ATCC 33500]EMA03183.1 hypothetical protein C439_04275 [Haloferax mediterranei ATCC 33500]MDX5989050.1 hypothetical protein [Haloferax mediterranei ATCC 33500]QCQ75442.1 hypothetical protein E6P09_09235 [Haloferax mediterranei ATCC 33500]
MYDELARLARDDPDRVALGVELVFAAVALLGVAATLVSPTLSAFFLTDLGFQVAAVAIVALTVTSLLAASRRIVRFVTGRGGLSIESFWRLLEVMFAFFVTGIIAFAVQLGQFAPSVPDPRGSSLFVGLFLAFILAGVGLAVIVCLRGMWLVVNAEIQSALGAD